MKKLKIDFNQSNVFYSILVTLFLFSVIGIVNLQRKSNEKKQEIATQLETSQSASKNTSQEYAQKLLDEKKDIVCSFRSELPGTTLTGTLYVDKVNNRVRTDIEAPDKQGVTKLSHTIYTPTDIFVWYDQDSKGMRLNRQTYAKRLDEQKERYGEEATKSEMSFFEVLANLDEYEILDKPDVKCEEWQRDEFLFVKPPKVSFVDAVEFYNQLDARICQKCDEETTEASRLLCRQTLKCK